MLLFVAVYAVAWAKFAYVAMKFHVYDVVFHLFSWAQVSFFAATFPKATLLVVTLAAAALVVLILAWRAEAAAPFGRTARAGLAAIACAAAIVGGQSLAGRNADFFSSRHYAISSFIFSFADLPRLIRFGGLLEASADERGGGAVRGEIACAPGGPRPDIVLFLNESAMPPGIYPGIVFPAEAAPQFASFDGKVRRLRVETFGGATWLSDFSALTGLSTWSFGSARNFAAQFLTGRLNHSLPQYLKACGYDTTMIYPGRAAFAASDRFYRSIGFDRIVDRAVHRSPDDRQRDAFYYGLIIDTLRGAAAGRPQFIVASGMATHSPWDFRIAPEAVEKGARLDWNGDPALDEYLWRLVLAERDRKDFRARMRALFPERAVLYVSYGDHQPALRRIPLRDALRIADDGAARELGPTSPGFETYFALDGQNLTPQVAEAEPDILEIPHLPTVLIEAAGLPLDAVFARRRDLMRLCGGLYHTCPYRPAILKFHRWLADSGWIALD
jgi:hypothetical protein